MKTINNFIKIIIFLVVLNGGILLITYVLTPKIPSFYREKHYDAVFFGTSQSYCSFDPLIFDEYDLKTYNRGRQQQTMNYTYYYIKDALDVCDIDVVVLEVFGMFYEEADRGYKRWTESEVCVDDYWSIAFSEIRRDVYAGNIKYLDKIYELCQKKGAKLILVKAPLPCYDRVIEETNTVSDWAEEHDIELINYMRLQDVLELNFYTDSLDGGTHLNESGAGKVSKHLAAYLKENYFE